MLDHFLHKTDQNQIPLHSQQRYHRWNRLVILFTLVVVCLVGLFSGFNSGLVPKFQKEAIAYSLVQNEPPKPDSLTATAIASEAITQTATPSPTYTRFQFATPDMTAEAEAGDGVIQIDVAPSAVPQQTPIPAGGAPDTGDSTPEPTFAAIWPTILERGVSLVGNLPRRLSISAKSARDFGN